MKRLTILSSIGIAAVTILTGGCTTTIINNPSLSATGLEEEPLAIRIGPGNSLFVDEQPCPPGDLAARLSDYVKLKQTDVVIRGANVDDNVIQFITEACKKAGVHSISYALVKF
jgi:biopolymer transport protein ExbD